MMVYDSLTGPFIFFFLEEGGLCPLSNFWMKYDFWSRLYFCLQARKAPKLVDSLGRAIISHCTQWLIILFSENKTDLQAKVPMLSQVYCNSSVINPGGSCGMAGCALHFTALCLPLRVPQDYAKLSAGNILCLFTSIFTLCKFFILGGGEATTLVRSIQILICHSTLVIINIFYSPTNAQVIVLKTILKFTLKQLRHVSVQSHHLQGAHYPYLLKLHFIIIVN